MRPNLRFDSGARYGAGVVAACFGGYLAAATDFSAIVQSANYAGTIRTDVPLVNVAQFVLILATFVFAFAILPTPPGRRVAAVTLAFVALCLWATFGLERGTGRITEPVAFWAFVLDQGFVALLVSVGGWVIARGRHPLSWIVVAVAIVPAIASPAMVAANFTSGGIALVTQGIIIVGGLAAVWAAAGIDRALAGRARPSDERAA